MPLRHSEDDDDDDDDMYSLAASFISFNWMYGIRYLSDVIRTRYGILKTEADTTEGIR